MDPKPGLNLSENKKQMVSMVSTLQAGRSRVRLPMVPLEFPVELILPTAQ